MVVYHLGGALHQDCTYTCELRGLYSPPFKYVAENFYSITYCIDILGFLFVIIYFKLINLDKVFK